MTEFKIRDRRVVQRFFVDNLVVDQWGSEMGPLGIAVYISLCRHADIDDQECWLNHTTIAGEWGMSVSSVKRALSTLRDLLLIDWEESHRPDGSQRCNTYWLLEVPQNLPTTWAKAEAGIARKPAKTPELPPVPETEGVGLTEPPPSSPGPTMNNPPMNNPHVKVASSENTRTLTQKGTRKLIDLRAAFVHKLAAVTYLATDHAVIEIDLTKEDSQSQIWCPDCQLPFDWPQTEGARTKAPALTCPSCQARFVITARKGSNLGAPIKKYRHPDISLEEWHFTLPEVPPLFDTMTLHRAQACEVLYAWSQDAQLLREKFFWILGAAEHSWTQYLSWHEKLDRALAAWLSGRKSQARREVDEHTDGPSYDDSQAAEREAAASRPITFE